MAKSAWLAPAVLVTGAFALLMLGAGAAQGQNSLFDAGSLSCGDFVDASGNGERRTTFEQGRLWVMGYLAGYYSASSGPQSTGDTSGQTVDQALMQNCRGFPDTSLQKVSMLTLSTENHALPEEPHTGFRPASYSCADHTSARDAGGSPLAAAADLWAFAFIQGYKNVETPYVAIPTASMSALAGMVSKHCRTTPDAMFQDLVAEVARAIRLEAGG